MHSVEQMRRVTYLVRVKYQIQFADVFEALVQSLDEDFGRGGTRKEEGGRSEISRRAQQGGIITARS